MRRALFNLAAAISVFIAMIVFAFFIAGRLWSTDRRMPLVELWRSDFIDSRDNGCIGLRLYHDWPTPNVSPLHAPNSYPPEYMDWNNRLPLGRYGRWLGFYYHHEIYREGNGAGNTLALGWNWQVSVPFWAMWLAWVSPIPFVIVIGRRIAKARRAKRGLCITCGYDLRASPQRCPECGAMAVLQSQLDIDTKGGSETRPIGSAAIVEASSLRRARGATGSSAQA